MRIGNNTRKNWTLKIGIGKLLCHSVVMFSLMVGVSAGFAQTAAPA